MNPRSGHDRDGELTDFCGRELPKLIGVLTLYSGNRALGEELAQEALARLCLRWAQVRDMRSPEAWVHRVGINLANSYFRRRLVEMRAHRRTRGTETATREPDAADAIAIRKAVASLPRRQRAAVVLRYYADLKVSEVADLMDCPESTVKTLTRRGIERLRADFAPEQLKEASDVG